MQTASCPEIGIHQGIPADQYHGWNAASNSRLTHLLRSPAHLKECLDNPPAPTPAMTLGSALHSLVLEPALFAAQYCQAGQCAATTAKKERCSNTGKICRGGEWYCGTRGHDPAPETPADQLQVLSADQWTTVHRMAESVRSHPAASALLGLAGEVESSVVWTDPATGVRCKARLDKTCPSIGTIVDIKTTVDAGLQEFPRSIVRYGYHRQAAHYLAGAAAAGIPVRHFVIIAVEKTAPHAVAVYRLDEAAVTTGRQQIQRLLSTYATCRAADAWPAYNDGIQDIGLPAWVPLPDDEEEEELAAAA